jgi:hypothetical protein
MQEQSGRPEPTLTTLEKRNATDGRDHNSCRLGPNEPHALKATVDAFRCQRQIRDALVIARPECRRQADLPRLS